MRELSANEIYQVSGCGLVGDGAACIGGGVAAIAGILTVETGFGAAIAWGGYVAAAGACFEFGVDLGKAADTGKLLDVSSTSYSDYTVTTASGALDDYGIAWENSNGSFETASYSFDMGFTGS